MPLLNNENCSKIIKLPDHLINRIAAGEVVHRPSNAVKELIENSLDAGAKEIVVSVRQGGLKLIQIVDDGSGINKEDLSIICCRFTTSKLREFDDLTRIDSFGFRGEALASISHVAHLSITSKVVESQCAYKCQYKDGLPKHTPVACAGNQGTTILVEDLFYCDSRRKNCLSSPSEELNRISSVVGQFAVHYCSCSFVLKRQRIGADFRTKGDGNRATVIAGVVGGCSAKDLIAISDTCPRLSYDLNGYFLRSNFVQTAQKRQKKSQFMFFINNRPVDCQPLKSALGIIFSINNIACTFVYLNLKIDPKNVDVNVHPTKKEVRFLDQNAIIDRIQQLFENCLLENAHQNRSHSSLSSPSTCKMSLDFRFQIKNDGKSSKNNPVKSRKDQELVRIDEKATNLGRFVTEKGENDQESSPNDQPKMTFIDRDFLPNDDEPDIDTEQAIELLSSELTEIVADDVSQCPTWREIHLSSLNSLRTAVCSEASFKLRQLLRNHSFVGCVDHKWSIVQSATGMYMLDVHSFSSELFYQIALFRFGNFGVFNLSERPSIGHLYRLVKGVENRTELVRFRSMLLDYFSLNIIDDKIASFPSLLSDYRPQLEGLPQFVYGRKMSYTERESVLSTDLANSVDWTDETKCFDGICRQLASFFAFKGIFCHEDSVSAFNSLSWRQTVEIVLFPAFKKRLLPPEKLLTNGSVRKLADLRDMYKVFERC